jgi:hypothetical protein
MSDNRFARAVAAASTEREQPMTFDDTSYNAWRDAITAKHRAEYAPYDTMMEFDVGFAAGELGIYENGWHDFEAQAFDRGLECFHRLARVFQNT